MPVPGAHYCVLQMLLDNLAKKKIKKNHAAEPWSHFFLIDRTWAPPSSCTRQWGVQYIIFLEFGGDLFS